VSPVRYKLGFYIPEDDILHSHLRENLNSFKAARFFVNEAKKPMHWDITTLKPSLVIFVGCPEEERWIQGKR
jgi:hypothetical protein